MKTETSFIQKNYQKESTFSSFLPGIAGEKGIPIWCFYVNRGQGVVSFGVSDKDHSIMEYYPAHQAYQNVNRLGFRTFLKKDGAYMEAFQRQDNETKMLIFQNLLQIKETLKQGLEITVTYFTLPKEPLGALVREVCIKNTGDKKTTLEVLDGMPAIIPYGVSLDSLKSMGQTAKAWMQVEQTGANIPYFRVRASMDDTADVKEIQGGNFGYGCLFDGEKMPVFVDPVQIFSYDTSFYEPIGFIEKGLDALKKETQRMQNQLPCCFFGTRKELEPKEELVFYEMIGQVESQSLLDEFFQTKKQASYFEMKKLMACELTQQLCEHMETRTANETFDAYCKYTYMDNVLRGGYPILLGKNKIFYLYSRKHGDLERDYNYFSVAPEFYSQGNGNYRDVNQNRRCDTFFAPFIGRENIKQFYSLIQLDGYNPLGIEKITYRLSQNAMNKIKKQYQDLDSKWQNFEPFFNQAFTPGSLYEYLCKELEQANLEEVFLAVINESKKEINGAFLEGYWSDHWTYNLDLIFDYLEIYPEEEVHMLMEEEYSYFVSGAEILERKDRYVQTQKGIRQYHFTKKPRKVAQKKEVCGSLLNGAVYHGTLFEKLLLLCTIKVATLDSYGMGVEMEGGKPGWYDALNGLPGMLGSSMAETYELLRMITYTRHALTLLQHQKIEVFLELKSFMQEVHEMMLKTKPLSYEAEAVEFWEKVNAAKEAYRNKVYEGIAGEKTNLEFDFLNTYLEELSNLVSHGIKKAKTYHKNIVPTYFTFEVTDYECSGEHIFPKQLKAYSVASFLEGPVRYLKLDQSIEEKKALYQEVKNSDLYDDKLQMYKVNASLDEESYELGRARAFTPGWLENESIWLHMEYKYLLELLKSELYEEFFQDFKKAGIPFLKEEVYGRSLYENSSFIASSKNPDEKIHGKGFVARLSGSTIEFISMWKQMMFGKHYFTQKKGEVFFTPSPAIPNYLIPEDKKIEVKFLSKIDVIYRFAKQRDYIPGNYNILQMKFYGKNKDIFVQEGGVADAKITEQIRNFQIKQIEITLE